MNAQVKKALEVIKKIYSDTSVTPEQTMSRLKEIREEINTYIESLCEDLKMEDD